MRNDLEKKTLMPRLREGEKYNELGPHLYQMTEKEIKEDLDIWIKLKAVKIYLYLSLKISDAYCSKTSS